MPGAARGRGRDAEGLGPAAGGRAEVPRGGGPSSARSGIGNGGGEGPRRGPAGSGAGPARLRRRGVPGGLRVRVGSALCGRPEPARGGKERQGEAGGSGRGPAGSGASWA